MAGTLTISTLSDGTNSTSATNPILGSAKAWVNFDGTLSGTITPRASYNVNSVTKNSTGNYTVNFTNALADASYAAVTGFNRTSGLSNGEGMGLETYSYTTTSMSIVLNYYENTAYDVFVCSVAFFR
jgi:hypothetical protein